MVDKCDQTEIHGKARGAVFAAVVNEDNLVDKFPWDLNAGLLQSISRIICGHYNDNFLAVQHAGDTLKPADLLYKRR